MKSVCHNCGSTGWTQSPHVYDCSQCDIAETRAALESALRADEAKNGLMDWEDQLLFAYNFKMEKAMSDENTKPLAPSGAEDWPWEVQPDGTRNQVDPDDIAVAQPLAASAVPEAKQAVLTPEPNALIRLSGASNCCEPDIIYTDFYPEWMHLPEGSTQNWGDTVIYGRKGGVFFAEVRREDGTVVKSIPKVSPCA